MTRSPWLALGVAFVALASCRAGSPTGVFVTARFGGRVVDQLELSVTGPSADAATVPPTARPVAPAGPLPSPQTVAIYLPDGLAGTTVVATVTVLLAGTRLATASAPVQLHAQQLADVELDIPPPSGDAGAPPDAGSDAPTSGKANGQSCRSDDECDSTLCVDGVCCGSSCGGLCQACNVPGHEGTCASVSAGTRSTACAQQMAVSCGFDGTCDGSGGCRRYPAGVACASPSCQGSTLSVAAACDGQGTCLTAPAIACAPYACDVAAARCRTTCAGDADCAGASCDLTTGSCGPKQKRADGAGCVAAADCISGFCQDGVCCDSACAAGCNACNRPAALGVCGPVAVGKLDPHGICLDGGAAACGPSGLCDGAGACALYAAGTTCAAGTCNGGHFLRASMQCDGKGACVTAPDIDCDPYRCDGTTLACFMSCTDNKQCANGLGRACTAAGICQ
jgi:hypothetical protein